jgi:hypothetical protein
MVLVSDCSDIHLTEPDGTVAGDTRADRISRDHLFIDQVQAADWLWEVCFMNNPLQNSYFVIRMPQTMVLFVIRKLRSISDDTVSLSF